MQMRPAFLLATLALLPGLAFAGAPQPKPLKAIPVIQDRAAFANHLRIDGHKARGGIDKSKTEREDGRDGSFPHFTSSFTVGGQTYPFTMVGYPPASGRTTHIRSVIIPLRMHFVGFAQDVTFEPGKAVDNIVNSPLYNDASFANGVGQFGDQMQRATFWNKMDAEHKWHVKMDRPRIARTVDVLVEPDVGTLQLTAPPGDPTSQYVGNFKLGALDSTIHTILQFSDIDTDELPIFVTYNVTADALGYHDAFAVPRHDHDDAPVLQTLIFSTWLEPTAFGDLLADVSTFNHELSEWMNDPYVNNLVPTWNFPLSNICSGINSLEVGDPQGNGPNFFLFPTVPITLRGTTYHLQDLVMLPWFADESPSSAQNGWYDFPATTQLHAPATYCGP